MNQRNIIGKELMFEIFKDYLELAKKEKISWEEFSLLINEKYTLNFTSSAFRKKITAYLEAQELFDKLSNNEFREKIINIKEIKLEVEKNKNKNLIKELKELKKEYLHNNELNEIISTFVTPSVEEIKEIKLEKNEESNLFILSDLQCDGTGFTKDIYEYVYQKISNIIDKENLKHIYLMDNGDIIDGNLFVSSLLNNKSFIEQLKEVQLNLALFLERLSKKVKISFSIINSNHLENRILGFKAGETKQFDITMLILEYLKVYLKDNKNIIWLNKYESPIDLNYNIIKIQGYIFFQQHGDMKGLNINNPFGTFDKINRYFDYDIDYCIFGHLHHLSIKSINLNRKKGGNKMVIWVPALDPRQRKENEEKILVSSAPQFTRIKIEKGNGITCIETISLSKKMMK